MRPSSDLHDTIEELIAADALGGLDESGRQELDRELQAHGPDCPECLRLRAEYSEVAAGLATTLDPIPLSPGAEDRLLEAARAWDRDVQTGAAEMLRPGRVRRTRPGGLRVKGWVVAAAAAVIALVAGTIGHSLAPGAADLRAVPFPAQGGQHLAVVFEQGGSHAVVVGSGLSQPPDGKVYQLWYRPSPDAAMKSGGTFEPDANGSVVAPATVGDSFVFVAVSVEPDGGSPAPTTAPVFQAAVS